MMGFSTAARGRNESETAGAGMSKREDLTIDGLSHVFNQDAVSCLDCTFNDSDHVVGPHPGNLEGVLALPLLDPDSTLELGVHHERPSLRVGENGSVLHRGGVRGQALLDPAGDNRIVHENLERITDALSHWGLPLLEELDPVVNQRAAELGGEGTSIADKGSCKEHIASEDLVVLAELLNSKGPSLALRGKGSDEAVGKPELALAPLALADGGLLLVGGSFELVLKVLDHCIQLGNLGLDLCEGRIGLLELCVGSSELHALGLDLRDHVKVHDNVDGPLAETSSSPGLVVDRLLVEVGQGKVLTRGFHRLLLDASRINDALESLQSIEELVDVVHQLAGSSP